MDFPIHIDTFCTLRGRKLCFSVPAGCFLDLANSADPDEMHLYAAFIWVFTVCQSTHFDICGVIMTNT